LTRVARPGFVAAIKAARNSPEDRSGMIPRVGAVAVQNNEIIATDGLTLLFVADVTCALIGWLRNGRAKLPPKD
jgi:hypothetical protein